MEKKDVTINIIGSCVCRDLFRAGCVEKISHNFSLPIYVQGLSPICEYTPAINTLQNLTPEELVFGSPWERRTFITNLNKNVFKHKFQSDYLIVDLYYIISTIAKSKRVPDANFSEDEWFKQNKEVILQHEPEGFEYINPWNIDRNFVLKSIDKLACDILKRYKPHNIIFIDTLQSVEYLANDGDVKSFCYADEIKHSNMFLKAMTRYFRNKLSEGGKYCHQIPYVNNALCSEAHTWGLYPVHFCDEFYDYLIRSVDVIVSKYKRKKEELLIRQLHLECEKQFEEKRKKIK